jgi:hypothetical protein
VRPVILGTARRHGIDEEDILHAYRYPIRVFRVDDMTMLIGADRSGRLLEVGVVASDGVDFVVHAMQARTRFFE